MRQLLLTAGMLLVLGLCLEASAQNQVIGWRGDGTGLYPDATPPTTWSRTQNGESRNIRWETPLPGPGVAQPIIVNDKIFVLSEPSDLLCLDKKTGKILWTRSNHYFDALPEKEAKSDAWKEVAAIADRLLKINTGLVAKMPPANVLDEKYALEKQIRALMEKADEAKYTYPLGIGASDSNGGATAPTPVSDGKFVYVWLGSGVAACYDLDGNRKWIRLENHMVIHHGYNASPVLVGDKLIVYMRELMAFNAGTGDVVWRREITQRIKGGNPLYDYPHFHSSLLAFKINNEDYVALGSGQVVRARDGALVCQATAEGIGIYPTAVMDQQNTFYVLDAFGRYVVITMTAENGGVRETLARRVQIPVGSISNCETVVGSPILYDGLFYSVDNLGQLRVLEAQTGALVYAQKLELCAKSIARTRGGLNDNSSGGVVSASLAMAGKYLYVQDQAGTTLIFEPGRQFKLVSRNKIEKTMEVGHWRQHPEITMSAPIFEGKFLYLRGEDSLYCIGEK